ncbi:hypothetical protein SBV1_2590003 [Verrucomicrobia bacterium]|nr:hypothetical protein SBV1_2590003 [Verrucomicrobiota bacterium]
MDNQQMAIIQADLAKRKEGMRDDEARMTKSEGVMKSE